MSTQKRSTPVTLSGTTDCTNFDYAYSCTSLVGSFEITYTPTLRQRIEALLMLERVLGKAQYIHLSPHAQSIVYAELFEHD